MLLKKEFVDNISHHYYYVFIHYHALYFNFNLILNEESPMNQSKAIRLIFLLSSVIIILLGCIILSIPLSASALSKQAIINTVQLLNEGAEHSLSSINIIMKALYLKGVYFSVISPVAKFAMVLTGCVMIYLGLLAIICHLNGKSCREIFSLNYWNPLNFRLKP